MQEIVDKNAFETVTMLNNLVLIWRFQDSGFVFSLLYMIYEIFVFHEKFN